MAGLAELAWLGWLGWATLKSEKNQADKFLITPILKKLQNETFRAWGDQGVFLGRLGRPGLAGWAGWAGWAGRAGLSRLALTPQRSGRLRPEWPNGRRVSRPSGGRKK